MFSVMTRHKRILRIFTPVCAIKLGIAISCVITRHKLCDLSWSAVKKMCECLHSHAENKRKHLLYTWVPCNAHTWEITNDNLPFCSPGGNVLIYNYCDTVVSRFFAQEPLSILIHKTQADQLRMFEYGGSEVKRIVWWAYCKRLSYWEC